MARVTYVLTPYDFDLQDVLGVDIGVSRAENDLLVLGGQAGDPVRLTLTGSNFTYGPNGATGGAVTALRVEVRAPGDPFTDALSYREPAGVSLAALSDALEAQAPLAALNLLFGRADAIRGANGDDVIVGLDGADTIDAVLGNDHIFGGRGADVVNGGRELNRGMTSLEYTNFGDLMDYSLDPTAVRVDLAARIGRDGFGSVDRLTEIESVVGTRGDDTLLGDNFDNFFVGGLGDDAFNGRGGSDAVSYAYATTGVRVSLAAGTGRSTTADIDQLKGIEQVVGSAHDDVLAGDNLANTFVGGFGRDVMTGRGGVDTFVFLFDRGKVDLIQDFRSGVDKLAFDRDGFDLASRNEFDVRQGANPAATSKPTFLFDTDSKIISFDADGAGGADAVDIVQLAGVASIRSADFILV